MSNEQNQSDAKAHPVDTLVIQHDFRHDIPGCKVCKRCGMAVHNKKFQGFKFWYAGNGYRESLECR